MPVILGTWEAGIGRIVFQGQPGQIVLETPISKITRANGLRYYSNGECLLCEFKALSSNPSLTKKQKQKQKKNQKAN
jgi:hypothetical protein